MKQDIVVIGKIVASHGIKGMVKVRPFFDFPERVSLLSSVSIAGETYKIEKTAVSKRLWLFKFEDIDSREAADDLRGQDMEIPREERFVLPEGHYYIDDLIGLTVYESSGDVLGKIVNVLKAGGGNDIFVIKPPPDATDLPKEILFPALKHLVEKMSIEEGEIWVTVPEGLLEI